jgi:hypothetical protein
MTIIEKPSEEVLAEIEPSANGRNVPEGYVTGSMIIRTLNEWLKDEGIKLAPKPMAYNYIKNGMLDSEVVDGQKLVRVEVATEWMSRQLVNRRAKYGTGSYQES